MGFDPKGKARGIRSSGQFISSFSLIELSIPEAVPRAGRGNHNKHRSGRYNFWGKPHSVTFFCSCARPKPVLQTVTATPETLEPTPSATVRPTPTEVPTLPSFIISVRQTVPPEPTRAPSPTHTRIPAPRVVIADVVIRVASNAQTRVGKEYVLLLNFGQGVCLTNWMLSDDAGNTFVFPEFVLNSGEMVRIHSGAGQNGLFDLYWQSNESIWDNGGSVTLRNSLGGIVDQFALKEHQ